MIVGGPVQETYTQYQNAVATAGKPATMIPYNIDTYLCEDVSSPEEGIGFGLAVSRGTLHGDKSAGLGALSGGDFLGITVADPGLANLDSDLTDKYRDGENMGVLTQGDIWVNPTNDVTDLGADVYYDNATGEFRAGTAGSHTQVKSARWMTKSTNDRANGFAILRLTKSPDGNS